MTRFLDSNIFIYAYTNNPEQEKCLNIIEQRPLITNALVLMESYAKILTITKNIEIAQTAIKKIMKKENIKVIPFDNNLLFEAMKRQEKYKLKIADLIHYTTALLNNCKSVLSYDDHFLNLEIKREMP